MQREQGITGESGGEKVADRRRKKGSQLTTGRPLTQDWSVRVRVCRVGVGTTADAARRENNERRRHIITLESDTDL